MVNKNKELNFTFNLVNSLIRYDPQTGFLYWKERTPEMFANPLHDGIEAAKSFNEINAGKRALNQNCNGYKGGQILKTSFRAHRVAWLLYYGKWPEHQIDHINGIKDDNRIENLRDVTNEVNAKNLSKRKSNTSGFNGVTFDSSKNAPKQWRARVRHNGRKIHLGWFSTAEEASIAVELAKELYGYTQRHGL